MSEKVRVRASFLSLANLQGMAWAVAALYEQHQRLRNLGIVWR
jgi:hypothetical protein